MARAISIDAHQDGCLPVIDIAVWNLSAIFSEVRRSRKARTMDGSPASRRLLRSACHFYPQALVDEGAIFGTNLEPSLHLAP
jgi:hypothetical protein